MPKEFLGWISNGMTSALLRGPDVVWLPVPRFDSPSVFSSILDPKKGGEMSFSIGPGSRTTEQYYPWEGVPIIRTVLTSDRGRAELTHFVPLGLPGVIVTYDSTTQIEVRIWPRFEYGLITSYAEEDARGLIFRNPLSKEGLEILVNSKLNWDGEILTLPSGTGFLFLLHSKDLRYGLFSSKGFVYSEPYEALEKARRFWSDIAERARPTPEPRMTKWIRTSIMVILGSMYFPSGGVIASTSCSLPEVPREDRNWDYRYVWVRDAAYSARALVDAGLFTRAKRSLDFLTSVIDPSSKSFDHPLYTVDGTPPPVEEELKWLSGYEDSRPVRVGNGAYTQVQTDVEGAYMDALYHYLEASKDRYFAEDAWWAVESIAGWVSKNWENPTTDIWEQRGVSYHFVHSKVMQWVAMDRASRIAYILGEDSKRSEWNAVANQIRVEVLREGFSQKHGTFVQHYGTDEVDAALLTLPIYGFISADDHRFLKTLKRIEDELSAGKGLYLRYRKDFMGKATYPFTLVSAWASQAYIMAGNVKRGVEIIESLMECATTLGLLSEHVDPSTCEPRGNFPQVFVHAGLISAITQLGVRG